VDAAAADRRPSTRRLLLVLGAIVAVVCVAFGLAIVRQQRAFAEYRAATLESGPMPWTSTPMTPDDCVRYAVDWAMACPGLGTWCESEAPRVVGNCMAAQDRATYCAELGVAGGSTEFGYAQCTEMRAALEGQYAQRGHKKFCAAGYRAVAEHCRRSPG
jgi:hypothetical protein